MTLFQTNKNPYQVAILLAEQNFEELIPTNNYQNCTHVFIDKGRKKYWLADEESINHAIKINQESKREVKPITVKEIIQWRSH